MGGELIYRDVSNWTAQEEYNVIVYGTQQFEDPTVEQVPGEIAPCIG
jgi:hypothetical protein